MRWNLKQRRAAELSCVVEWGASITWVAGWGNFFGVSLRRGVCRRHVPETMASKTHGIECPRG